MHVVPISAYILLVHGSCTNFALGTRIFFVHCHTFAVVILVRFPHTNRLQFAYQQGIYIPIVYGHPNAPTCVIFTVTLKFQRNSSTAVIYFYGNFEYYASYLKM